MRLFFLQEWFSNEIVKAIGWTLIHSLWQGVLAAVLAGIIIIGTKRTAARHRYNLLGVVLLLFTLVVVITFSQQLNGSVNREEIAAEPSITVTGNVFTESYYNDSGTGSTTFESFARYFNANADLIVLTWAIFFLFHFIKLFTGLAGIQRIRNYRTHASSEEWRIKLLQLSNALGLKQTVGLFQSEIIRVPVAIGFFKPVILVPLGLLSNLPAEQVETILLHELAHIRRRDYGVNILQRLIEAVFFFNPALLWVSSLLRQEREACCDDIVVANTTHKGTYLQALVSFQEYSFAGSRYAMAIKSKQHYLLNRVKRMITRENKKLDVMEKVILIAGLFAVSAFSFISKKDAINKPTVTVGVNAIDETFVAPAPSKKEVVTGPKKERRTSDRKENKKPAVEIPESILPIDTVPPSKKISEKEKTEYNDLKFPSISSSINDDGKTKTEDISVTDGNGKKYSYTKLNGKVTSLVIDGKKIPENEYENYSPLLEKIDMVMQENKKRRLIQMERRKLALAQRSEDSRNRVFEQNQQRRNLNLQRQYHLEQNRQSRNLNKSEKELENKRKIQLRLQLRKGKPGVPMLNGRQISQNDIHIDNSTEVDVVVNSSLNKTQEVVLQKMANLKIASNNSVEKNLHLKPQEAIQLKSDLHFDIKSEMHYDVDVKPVIGLNPDPVTINQKPSRPVKITNGVKISVKTEPVKLKLRPANSLMRRVTT